MKISKSFLFITTIIICINFLFGVISYANTGKYAILLFGGTPTDKSSPDNEPYIQYEMAPMHGTLMDEYDIPNANIYVHNYSGNKNEGYDDFYEYWDDYGAEPTNYRPAKTDSTTGIRKTFRDLNTILDQYDDNILFIFICGHKGTGPNGQTHFYRFYNAEDVPDTTFASWMQNDLLNYNNNDIINKVKIAMVAGFCGSLGYYDNVLGDRNNYPDKLKDIATYISYAVADCVRTGTVQAAPGSMAGSYMMAWREIVENNTNISFNEAWKDAKDTLFVRWNPDPFDTPYKADKGNWDHKVTLNSLVTPEEPMSLNIAGFSDPKVTLGWSDMSTNESGFKIHRSLNNGTYTEIGSVGANVKVYNDTDISSGNTYAYKIKAFNSATYWTTKYSDYTSAVNLPLICWNEGPTSLQYRDEGTWYANYAGDPEGSASFQWYKRYNYSNWALQGTDSSQTLEMRTTDFWVKFNVSISSTTISDSIYVTFDDSKKIHKSENVSKPKKFSLNRNYPNPFNATTLISFELPEDAYVKLSVLDIRGREISILFNERLKFGSHQVKFDASNLSSGIYFYKLHMGGYTDIKRMLLLK